MTIFYENKLASEADVAAFIAQEPSFHLARAAEFNKDVVFDPSKNAMLCRLNTGWLGNVGTWPETEYFRCCVRRSVKDLNEFWGSAWHMFPSGYNNFNSAVTAYKEMGDGNPMRAWRLYKESGNRLYVARQAFRGNEGEKPDTWGHYDLPIFVKPDEWFRTTIHVVKSATNGVFELYHNGVLVFRKTGVETLRNVNADHNFSAHQCYTRNVPENVVLWNWTRDIVVSDELLPLGEEKEENRFLLLFLILLAVFGVILINSSRKWRS